MFPRRRTASTVFVAAMCSWLLAATVAPSGQQSVTEETGRVVAIVYYEFTPALEQPCRHVGAHFAQPDHS